MSDVFVAWMIWLSAIGTPQQQFLNPPASEAQIAALEAKIGYALPDDVKALYRSANGQKNHRSVTLAKGQFMVPFFGQYHFLSTEEAARDYQGWKDIRDDSGAQFDEDFNGFITVRDGDAVHREYWHPGWLPIAVDGGGNHYGIDLSPAPGGKYGQVILFGPDEDQRRVLAPDATSFLTARMARPANFYRSDDYASVEMEE
jgi:cell wall assembly regulator SMI1